MRKVEISATPFQDIKFFHLEKFGRGKIRYLAVNFEQYPAFIKGIENCECCFSAFAECNKTWLLMLETKYCKPENVEGHAFKAYSQMNETLSKMETLHLVDRTQRNVYFAYSVPEHDDLIPFGAFTITQNEILQKLERSGIHLLGNNRLLITTPQYLFEPQIHVG